MLAAAIEDVHHAVEVIYISDDDMPCASRAAHVQAEAPVIANIGVESDPAVIVENSDGTSAVASARPSSHDITPPRRPATDDDTHVHMLDTCTAASASNAANIDDIEGDIVILNGDHPLITVDDLKNFISDFREQKLELAVVSVELDHPGEFGRIIRQANQLKAIVETKDASADTLKVKEVNTGIYIAKAEILKKYLPLIKNNNSKKEFYLTDLISLAIENKHRVDVLCSKNKNVAHGVNNQIELAAATRILFQMKNAQLLNSGVIIIDPTSTYIEDTVIIGAGTVIYPGVFIRGKTAVGAFCVIEPNVFISDSVIDETVQIKAGSYLEQAIVHSNAKIGPYARLRPDTEIGESAHIGNFVELKKVKFGKNSKAGHLTYLGDAEIGENVNIGCGTITCNYAADKKKYKTIIGDRVFVGSDSQFVAPVNIGADSIIASGSTITKDVPADALAIARGRQENKMGLAAKFKKK